MSGDIITNGTETVTRPASANTRHEYVVQHRIDTPDGAVHWRDHHATPEMVEAKRVHAQILAMPGPADAWRVVERRTTVVEDVLP